jgi:predicted NAD/FAD-dependent oxidoreductase
MGKRDYEVIVIGAGFAGIAAAQELGRQGRDVLLLEARDRTGGRTWTDSFAGKQIEMGGTWVHWFQPYVWSALTKYGLEIVEDEPPARCLLASGDGLGWFDVEEAMDRLEDLNQRFFEGSLEYFSRPFDPLHDADAVAEIDALSIHDRLEQLGMTDEEKSWLSGMYGGLSGSATSGGAFSMVAHWWALAGWRYSLLWDCLSRYRFKGGTVKLVEAMLADTNADLQLEAPVASVDQSGDAVEVLTRSGQRISAAGVVVAVPANVWPSIEFNPALSDARTAAGGEGMQAADCRKVWVHIKGEGIGTVFGAPPEGYRFPLFVTYAELAEDEQLLVCFTSDPTLDPGDIGNVEAGIKELFPQAEVLGAHCHDWREDEFARGAHAFYKPEQLVRYLPALQSPEGRVAFATSDIASGWAGYIDGAIESGLNAAKEIHRVIDNETTQNA